MNSDRIRAAIPNIVAQRMAKAKKIKQEAGHYILPTPDDEQRTRQRLNEDPMTWIIALMGALDEQEAVLNKCLNTQANQQETIRTLNIKLENLSKKVKDGNVTKH